MKRKKRILISVLVITFSAFAIVGGIFLYSVIFDKEEVENNKTKENTSEVVEKEPVPVETSIVFTGDVLLSDYVLSNYNSGGIDKVIAPSLRDKMVNADFTVINEEFPFSTRGEKAPDKQYTFRVDPKYVGIIKEMGVDACGLANNHVLDFGKDALLDTFSTLNSASIQFNGAGNNYEEASRLITYEKGGVKIGIISCSHVIPVVSWNVKNQTPGVFTAYDNVDITNEIRKAKENCDLVFVMIHWGTEHTDVLTDYQRPMAHAMIDAGADCIIGSHPHVVQGLERYNGKMIFYSLGNFIFNQNIERTFAVGVKYESLSGNDYKNNPINPSYYLLPAKASGATTREMTSEEASSLYNYLSSISNNVTVDAGGSVI